MLFIINTGSGANRNPAKVVGALRDWSETHRVDADIRTTGSLAELDSLWSTAVVADADCVCAVGGDGTVLELGRRLAGTNKALAILPVGSGNGFARHLGIPMKLSQALQSLETAVPVRVDTGLADGHRFLGTFGLGFDAIVAHRFASAGTRGLSTYLRVGATSYFGYLPEEFVITVDGTTTKETALLLTVGNASQYGNDVRILPGASITDGKLDVCILRSAALLDAPRILSRLFSGRFDECSEVCIIGGREIVIERPAPGAAHTDGDPFEAGARVTVRVDPASLTVMVPATHVGKI